MQRTSPLNARTSLLSGLVPGLVSALLLALTPGCGGTRAAFHPSTPDSNRGELEEMLARLERPEGAPTLVGYSAREKKLVAYDLSARRVLFTHEIELAQAPLVAGDVIVVSDGSRALGLAREDGAELFALPLEGRELVGASGSGRSVILTFSGDSGKVVAVEGDRERWSRKLDHPVGVPGFGGELVVIPWAHQNLSFLRFADGVEVGRGRALGALVGHAEITPLGLVAGQSQLFLMGPEYAEDPRVPRDARLGPPALDLPGAPTLRSDAYAAPEPPSSARHKVLLDANPTRGERGLVPERGVHFFAFHSVVVGVERDDLVWAHRLEGPVAGMRAAAGGVYVAAADGAILFLSAGEGEVISRGALPLPVDVVTFANVSAPADDLDTRPSSDDPMQHLVGLARERNAQLTPIAKLAIASLGRHDDPATTAELAALCDEDSLAPSVKDAACKALGGREVGHEGLLEVLSRHASFLEGTSAPPAGPLARAAAKIGDRSLAPLLVKHLADPATRTADLADLAIALGELGDETAAESLGAFLVTYHAYADDPALADALVAAAHAYEKLAGPASAARLDAIAADPFTVPALARALRDRAR